MTNYKDKLFSEYQSERSSFRRLTIIALLLGVFFLLVYQPYLELLTEIYDGEKTIPEIENELRESKTLLNDAITAHERAIGYMGDASAYDDLFQEAEKWINDLDDIELAFDLQSKRIRALHDSVNNVLRSQWPFGTIPSSNIRASLNQTRPALMRSYSTSNECFFLIEEDWLNCELNSKRKPINEKLFRVLYDRTPGHLHTQKLRSEIDIQRKKFQQQRAERVAGGELIAWFQESLEAERKTIRRWYIEMARLRQVADKDLQKHEEKLKQHNDWLATLDSRKQELTLAGKISTPLGPIKLAFHDLLSLFPLFTLGLFSLMLFSQKRQLILRDLYIDESDMSESDYSIISQIMPIVIDPEREALSRRILTFLPFIIPPVFAWVSWLQLRSHPAFEIVGLTLNQPFIRVATGLVTLIFAYIFFGLLAQNLKISKQSA